MTTPAIINTILEQLGGRKIFAMAFASATSGVTFPSKEERDAGKQFGDPCLTLKIAPALVKGTLNKATHVAVTLDPSDTYSVTCYRITKRGLDVKPTATVSGVYADCLRETVELMTGLALTLGTCGRVSP